MPSPRDFLSLVVFAHTVFALPFALLSAVLAAGGVPSGRTLLWILVAMVGARSAAMSFNRIVDRRIDARNPRTARREIPAGVVSPAGRRPLLRRLRGPLRPRRRAAEPALPRSCRPSPSRSSSATRTPSASRRFAHLLLGLSLAIAPVGAWVAVTGAFALPPRPPRLRGPLLGRGLRRDLQPPGRGVRPGGGAPLDPGALRRRAGAPGRPPLPRGDARPPLRRRSSPSPAGGSSARRSSWPGVFLVRQHRLVSPGDLSRVERGLLHRERLALGRLLRSRRRRRPPAVTSRAPWGLPAPKSSRCRHIAIEGPIGVGKTSLAGLLAKRFSGTQILEDVKNPFLADFYEGRKGAAFQTQIYFLLSRYGQQQEIAQMDLFKELVIADYTFAKDKIFANLTLSDEEMRIYEKVWGPLSEALPKPDLVIHLTATRRHVPRRGSGCGAGRSRSRSRPTTSGSSRRPTITSSTTTGRLRSSWWTRTRSTS